mmetsp:Transcript_59637/g.96557  ORF Transcript_59637/g.96557 Transcript_59637/m.96557 type:complete len:228 (-) Transcript_59637:1259-1942(-)
MFVSRVKVTIQRERLRPITVLAAMRSISTPDRLLNILGVDDLQCSVIVQFVVAIDHDHNIIYLRNGLDQTKRLVLCTGGTHSLLQPKTPDKLGVYSFGQWLLLLSLMIGRPGRDLILNTEFGYREKRLGEVRRVIDEPDAEPIGRVVLSSDRTHDSLEGHISNVPEEDNNVEEGASTLWTQGLLQIDAGSRVNRTGESDRIQTGLIMGKRLSVVDPLAPWILASHCR